MFYSKLKNAKNGDDVENALEDLGEAASSGFASFRVARSFLKGGNLLKFSNSDNLKSEVVNLSSSAMPSKTYVGLVTSYLATALPSFFEKKEQKK